MFTLLIFIGLLGLFTPFVVMVGREKVKSDQRMAARFDLVRARGIAGVKDEAHILGDSHSVNGTKHLLSPIMQSIVERALKVLDFRVLAARAGSRIPGPRFFLICVMSQMGTAVVVWFVSRSLIGAFVLGFAAGYGPVALLRMQCGRRLKKIETVLPQIVEMIARALRAGHSLAAALSIVAEQAPEPARLEFGELFRKQKLGFPLRDALLELLVRVPSQELRVLVVGILVQRETGGNLTVILDRTSSVIRERLKLQGDVLVHTAQGRLTGWILCALPILLFAVIHIVNPGYTKDLTEDPLGRKCLYAGVGLLLLGAFLIQKIVNGIEV